ncbi:type VI secretion system tip protein VgrG, partial [Pseudomonas sp. SDO528_S397]
DTVEANTYSEFKVEEHHTVYADRKVEARADDHLTVAANQHVKIGTGQFIEAGQEIHLSSGIKLVLEAGSELTLKAAGSFVKIDGRGVTFGGPLITVNGGGSPGSGSGAAPLLPGPLKQADAHTAGQLLAPAMLNPFVRKSLQGLPLVPVCGKQANGTCTREVCPCLRR